MDERDEWRLLETIETVNEILSQPWVPASIAEYMVYRAWAYAKLGRHAEAIADCDTVLAIPSAEYGDNHMARWTKGWVLAEQGRKEEALDLYPSAARLHFDAVHQAIEWLAEARDHAFNADRPKSQAVLERFISSTDIGGEIIIVATFEVAWNYQRFRRYDDLIDLLNSLLARTDLPDAPRAAVMFWKFEQLKKMGRDEEAFACLAELYHQPGATEEHKITARAAVELYD